MKHIVFYSGGLGSYGAAKRVIAQHGAENTLLLFTDTKTEDADLYRFLRESATALSAELVMLADGRDVWSVFEIVGFAGNTRIDPCSRVLKRELAEKWIKANYTPETACLYFGIDWTEEHRFCRLQTHWQGWQVFAPLCEPPYLIKQDLKRELEADGIELPRLYALGFPHNNCGGFCVKAGKAHFALLYRELPDRYLYHEGKQETLFETTGKRHPFLRHTENGTLRYLSLREYRQEFLEKQGCDDLFDWGGCGCFVDGIEPEGLR